MTSLSKLIFKDAGSSLRPPPRLSLSEWADRYFVLSAESAAVPGRWHCYPYQRGILDAITDPGVEMVTFAKSARVGATKMFGAAIGYFMHYDPCPIMVVQPTVEDAQGYSKEEIAPMLRDCEVLSSIVKDQAMVKKSSATILHKTFPGGSLSMVGANSARGFRRVSRRVVIFDEVDGYPPSAGSEGDQIKLGIRRTEFYWNRKIIAASTPLLAGASRIEELFLSGDQRRFHVPCPQCGAMDILVFRPRDDGRGHVMRWPKNRPEEAFFECRENGCVIEHTDKLGMLEGGKWIADKPENFKGHASFHIWAAYSMSPNASWGNLAAEFVDANVGGTEKLKTFVNTVLGETWTDRGDAPSWHRLYNRRLKYPIGSVPTGKDIVILTCGVDVQKDRLEYEVVGWNLLRQSWSVDAGELYGDTANESTWSQLDELLGQTFPMSDGSGGMQISMMAVDSGYNTQQVYAWCSGHPMSRVIAVKGMSTERALVSSPSHVEITPRGKRLQRGYKVWPVGPTIAKSEFYGWLGLEPGEDGELPPGYCSFPEYAEDYFLQITAEHLVPVRKKGGYTALEWQLIPGRQNHKLDCRVYARVAASVKGLDRARPRTSSPTPKPTKPPKREQAQSPPAMSPKKSKAKPRGGWMSRRRDGRR